MACVLYMVHMDHPQYDAWQISMKISPVQCVITEIQSGYQSTILNKINH